MASTIKVPGVGPVKSTYVYAGGGIAVGIVAYAYWRAGRGGAEEVVEDETGEEVVGTDLGAESALEYDYALGAGGYDYGPGGTSYPSYTYPTTGNNYTSNLPTTNAEWAQAAREQLAGEGAASDAASSAIGSYLARLCVSTAQADLIRRANAMIGSPPQGTYAIIPCGAGSPTTPKPTTPSPTKPPSGSTLKAPTGVRVLRTFRTEVQVGWTGVKDAAGYAVYRSEPGSATSTWQRQTTTVYPSFQFKGLRPNTSYRFKIESIGRDGKAGASTTVTARTKK